MLDRRHRLTSSAGFAEATRRGRRAGSRTLVVHLVAGDTTEPQAGSQVGPQVRKQVGPHVGPLVGVVVSRAVGGAVVRNRVKRRLRHLVRARLGLLPRSTMVVLRALPPAADASWARLAGDLDSALTRLGVAAEAPGSSTR
jgi:ribonuclease P protein component